MNLAWIQPGPFELLIILFVVLLLFGGKKLPGLSRALGRSLSEFKKGKQEGEEDRSVGDSGEDPAQLEDKSAENETEKSEREEEKS